MNSVIELRDIKKSYPGFLLDIPSLQVPAGYITGFIGENGAGKTTTLRMVMDLFSPDSGSIRVLGGDMRSSASALKQEIGYVDSLAYFNPAVRVGRAKSLVAPFYRNWDEELYQTYRKRFGIQENKRLKELSSGQNKLFSLVMAICHHPKLLILDEPTASLDPVIRSELLDILAELLQGGDVSIFYSTHITSDLDKTADYIAYLHEGRVLLFEEKDRMLEEFRLAKGPCEVLAGLRPYLIGVRETAVGFTALTRDSAAVTQLCGDAVQLEPPHLEDIMIYHAKRGDA